MPVDLSLVEGEYFQDLLSQPRALGDTLKQLADSRITGSYLPRTKAQI